MKLDNPVTSRRLPASFIRIFALACVLTSVAHAQMKWNPGHYMQVMRGSYDAIQANRFAYYDDPSFANSTSLQGAGVFYRWSQLEGSTRGDYSAGIAMIQAEVTKLKGLAVPKRLAIRILDSAYGGSLPASSYFPAYLYNAGKLIQTNNQVIWKRWDSQTMGVVHRYDERLRRSLRR